MPALQKKSSKKTRNFRNNFTPIWFLPCNHHSFFDILYAYSKQSIQLIRGNYIMQECKSREKTTFTGKVDENFRYEWQNNCHVSHFRFSRENCGNTYSWPCRKTVSKVKQSKTFDFIKCGQFSEDFMVSAVFIFLKFRPCPFIKILSRFYQNFI